MCELKFEARLIPTLEVGTGEAASKSTGRHPSPCMDARRLTLDLTVVYPFNSNPPHRSKHGRQFNCPHRGSGAQACEELP